MAILCFLPHLICGRLQMSDHTNCQVPHARKQHNLCKHRAHQLRTDRKKGPLRKISQLKQSLSLVHVHLCELMKWCHPTWWLCHEGDITLRHKYSYILEPCSIMIDECLPNREQICVHDQRRILNNACSTSWWCMQYSLVCICASGCHLAQALGVSCWIQNAHNSECEKRRIPKKTRETIQTMFTSWLFVGP